MFFSSGYSNCTCPTAIRKFGLNRVTRDKWTAVGISAMPVGNKLNHNDPEWRKKLQQRIYKREWQRAKRANDKGDVAATAATVEENNPPPTVRLVFSRTNLQHGRLGAVAAAVKGALNNASAAVRTPLRTISTRRAEQEAAAVEREAAVQEELREKSEELLAKEKLIEELRAQLAAHHHQEAGWRVCFTAHTGPPTAPLPKRQRRARPVGQTACECGCKAGQDRCAHGERLRKCWAHERLRLRKRAAHHTTRTRVPPSLPAYPGRPTGTHYIFIFFVKF